VSFVAKDEAPGIDLLCTKCELVILEGKTCAQHPKARVREIAVQRLTFVDLGSLEPDLEPDLEARLRQNSTRLS
jgi:hypothetical protein